MYVSSPDETENMGVFSNGEQSWNWHDHRSIASPRRSTAPWRRDSRDNRPHHRSDLHRGDHKDPGASWVHSVTKRQADEYPSANKRLVRLGVHRPRTGKPHE